MSILPKEVSYDFLRFVFSLAMAGRVFLETKNAMDSRYIGASLHCVPRISNRRVFIEYQPAIQ